MELVDISYFCKVSQSSLLKHSEKKELQNVLFPEDHKLSFHTDFEKEPWFQIKLPYEASIREIVIHNIKNSKFSSACKYISVFVSIDGKTWEEVHRNDKEYGYYENALKIVLKKNDKYEFIKICNTNNYLCASRIQIFVDKKANNAITLVSDRRDGLCQRIIGILETMAVADYFGFNFGFTWVNNKEDNHFHDVGKVENMFSIYYVSTKYVSDKNIKKIRYGDIFVTPVAKDVIDDDSYSIDYSALYSDIKFSNEISEAIDFVNKLQLPQNLVGIHLRAGDIVYGMHNNNPLFINKVLEFPFLLHALDNEDLTKIILIGQDKLLIEAIKKSYGVTSSDDLYYKNMTSLQEIFFDIQLFIGCKKIYGADSGPVLLANSISGRSIIDLHQELGDDEKLVVLSKWILTDDDIKSNIPDLQIAYACFAYITYGFATESRRTLIKINNIARNSNVNNRVYDIFDLFLQYGFTTNEKAEKNVVDYIIRYGTIESPVMGYSILFHSNLAVKGLNHNFQYTESLKYVVQSGGGKLPYANLLLGLACYYINAHVEAGLYFRKYIEAESMSQTPGVIRGFFEESLTSFT